MPFMIGPAPIRRTLNYLNYGKLIFKDQVKVLSINYNTVGEHHQGARDFVFWYFPQIQYKNPDVQLLSLKDMTPSPFIRCFYENGKQLLIDIDGKNKEDILAHCIKVIGKSSNELKSIATQEQKLSNPSYFGAKCNRPCMCIVPGQVPCPGVIPLPNHMRGKYKNAD